MTPHPFRHLLATALILTLIAGCSSKAPRPRTPDAPPPVSAPAEPVIPPATASAPSAAPAENVVTHLQVLDKGRVSVQLRTASPEQCKKTRQDMLKSAEKASPGTGAQRMGPSLICTRQAQELPYSIRLQNLDYQFATRESCERYAVAKGLYPPKPAHGTKSPCFATRQ